MIDYSLGQRSKRALACGRELRQKERGALHRERLRRPLRGGKIGKHLLAGYENLGGPAAFGSSLTQAEAEQLGGLLLRSKAAAAPPRRRPPGLRDREAVSAFVTAGAGFALGGLGLTGPGIGADPACGIRTRSRRRPPGGQTRRGRRPEPAGAQGAARAHLLLRLDRRADRAPAGGVLGHTEAMTGSGRHGWQRLGGLIVAGLLAESGVCAPAEAAEAPGAFLRVNQVGYAPTAAKRAYVIAEPLRCGRALQHRALRRDDRPHRQPGRRRSAAGAAPSRTSTRSTSTAPGERLLSDHPRRAGPRQLPALLDRGSAALYGTPLANALSFYENERDGPEFIPSALRSAPGHLNDATASTYATPKVNREGSFKKELRIAAHDDRRLGRMVGRRGLPEVRADDQLHGR